MKASREECEDEDLFDDEDGIAEKTNPKIAI